MWLVRVLPNSGVKVWHSKREPSLEELSKRAFALSPEADARLRVSTYLVSHAEQEALAVAAHYGTLNRNHLQETWALRIRIEPSWLSRMLSRSPRTGKCEGGLSFDDEEPGRTGVQVIDALHRDVIGTAEEFVALSQRIHLGLLRGELRLRHLGKGYLEHALRGFLHGPGVKEDAIDAFRTALSKVLD